MKSRPKIVRAIFTSLITFLEFSLLYILIYVVVSVLISLLSALPLIGTLIEMLFHLRGDTPDMMLTLLSPCIAFYITMESQAILNKHKKTRGLSCVLLGIFIMVLHIVSLVINLVYGDGILKNIVQAIAGLIFVVVGIDIFKDTDQMI